MCSLNHPGNDVCTGDGSEVIALKVTGAISKVQLCLECTVETLKQEKVNITQRKVGNAS